MGLLPSSEEVREKEQSGTSLAVQWPVPSGLYDQGASSLGPPPPTYSPLTQGHGLSGLLPSSVHGLYPEPGLGLEHLKEMGGGCRKSREL